MKMSKKYKEPPIIEALCEFRFEPSESWDLATPGLIYEKIRKQFPNKRQISVLENLVESTSKGIEQKIVPSNRLQCLTKKHDAVVQIGSNLLAVSQLKPYTSWEKFVPLIRLGYDAYREVVSPNGFKHIALRYINRIGFDERKIALEKLFEFRPFFGPKFPKQHGSFVVGVMFPFEKKRDTLQLQLASTQPGVSETSAFILDLNYFIAKAGEIPLDSVFDWFETAHLHVEKIFEASIKDSLRKKFKVVN